MKINLGSNRVNVDTYFQERLSGGKKYDGQMTESFQKALEDYHAAVTEADCSFYHTIDFGEGRLQTGAWDLRGHEDAYLGGYDVAGKRVLEAGPASGFLSAYMASKGADLVVLDLPLGKGPELVPFPEANMEGLASGGRQSVKRLRNSWWFTKRALQFKASAVYADIYDPPSDVGRFDVAVFGAILLHLSQPFRALQALAALTDHTIVVTDVVGVHASRASADGHAGRNALMIFAPSPLPNGIVHWWAFSPDAICHMLAKLGFSEMTVTTHSPKMMSSSPPMFTVVAHRPASKTAAA